MEIYLLQGPLFKQMHLSTYPVLRTDPLGIKICHEGASTKETHAPGIFKADKLAFPPDTGLTTLNA